MSRRTLTLLLALILAFLLVACQGESDPAIAYDPADLLFSGDVALEIVKAITENFPNRASAEINNELAAEWLDAVLDQLGWQCVSDEWEVVNYSRPLPLHNIICQLPGESTDEILLLANYDQSPETIEGADGNASGLAVLLLLAQILASEQPWPYTMVLAATDGEVYGQLGAQRVIDVHPDPERIIAAISLSNLGLDAYEGLGMSAAGLTDNYGPLWLQQTARQAAWAAGDLWLPQMPSELRQTLEQALPMSMNDQGPFVAAGVPAISLFGQVPDRERDQLREFYDTPADTFERQSAASLAQGGRVAEALIRQLQGMEEFPATFAPYLAYDGGLRLVPPIVFYLIGLVLAGLFFLVSYLSGYRLEGGYLRAFVGGLPHFLSLWLPFIASILLLYFFVLLGLLTEFDTFPATPKDPELMNPRWFIFIIWLIALWELLQIGRLLEVRYLLHRPRPVFAQIRALVFLLVALAIILTLLKNPVSTFIFIPVIAWLPIGGRHGPRHGLGKFLDILFFLVGGLFVYVLIYFVGYTVAAERLTALWYLWLSLSVQSIDFWTASLVFAVVAAGLALLISLPQTRRSAVPNEPAGELNGSDMSPDVGETDGVEDGIVSAMPLASKSDTNILGV